jgi:homopolymeric O-antigen transport system ATP-binding protein
VEPLIEVKNISKTFRIRHEKLHYLSLRESLVTFFKRNPVTSEDFYALSDVSFNVHAGESIGIIGRNGAGKSTLLKILSRITPPTSGKIIARGRMASLLEVGTGFHPELTGRENIFLNGSILGMSRKEIQKNFDAIVDFAETEKFLDTPLKQYSSGMQLRLAFAVAAFLENEILIIDEVLAVGDAEFQKKCMGKMKDISSRGRTVLFVSHNIGAVKSLCSRAIILKDGKVLMQGETGKVTNEYLNESFTEAGVKDWRNDIANAPGNDSFKIVRLELVNHNNLTAEHDIAYETILNINYINLVPGKKYQVSVHLMDNNDNMVLAGLNAPSASLNADKYYSQPYEAGEYQTQVKLPANFLNEGNYYFNVIVSSDYFNTNDIFLNRILSFSTHDSGTMKNDFRAGTWGGVVRPKLFWNTIKLS